MKISIIHFILVCSLWLVLTSASAQNVGIGVTTPVEKLDVNGRIRSLGLVLTSGGSQYDYLIKSSATGQVGFRKAHGGLAVNYIICMQGEFPTQGPPEVTGPFLGEIKIFAGNFAPYHWAFCHGQLVPIGQYQALFALLGTTYGGDGVTTFALPDLRSSAAIGFGQQVPAGYQWTLGEKVN